ncbi:CHASE2 domain-containing protein [Novosphingobium sp. P6W]|uniref:CHASE2 domain-containing protein n=1 Tax=Novosphingobium sp. P6W TaxID=1609758 RepID=UPI0005C2A429|nr:CHASE2 domain-containing protein [Novosphingobium sp. P6W]AXB79797.1 CHASE2 domain-containing protein [Novosphingobium sp. P6W]KIS30669.1 histidine kinase [Novosphingobium sp. P6W]
MILRRGLKLRTQWWLIAIVTSLLVAGMTMDRTMMRIDNLIYDHLLQASFSASSPPTSKPVLLVEIDDESIRRLGRWPWSRATHAALIDRLSAGRPKAIAYDVLFTEAGDPNDDRLLGQSAAGSPIFFPMLPAVTAKEGSAAAALMPIDPVRAAAAGVGYATIDPDADGVVRSATTMAGAQGQWHHLMGLVAGFAAGREVTDARARLIPFSGGQGRWPEVSAASVLAGEVPPELLQDKIILVGATASGLGSRYPTPTGSVMSGLEIEAYLLQGMRDGAMIRPAGLWPCLALALLPLWALMVLLGPVRRLPALANFALCAAFVLGSCVAALMLWRLWLPPGAALTGLAIAYPLWGWRQLAVIEQFMRAQLERLDHEPSLVPQAEPSRRERGVAYTIRLLRAAITRDREMRHFLTDRLDQLPDATLVLDLQGRIVMANAAAHTLFASIGGPIDGTASAAALLQRFRQTGSGDAVPFPPSGEGSAMCEVQVEQARFFLIGMAAQTSTEGARVGWVIRFVDISEAKSAQRQRDDFVQLLTHDMRSPQASILAVLETASPDRISAQDSVAIRHYAESTLRLADEFVQLARAENLEYALEEVELGDMLMDAIDDLWPQSKAKSIDIVTRGDEPLLVMGERSLLTRALGNVIGNAIKYSPQGTTITCALHGETRRDGTSWAHCAITDQGPGMDADLRMTIFERFRRGPVGLGPKTSGAGLGLSFVHTVVLRHHGEIECESEPGRGTTFTFSLPGTTECERIRAQVS